jgi:nitroreductase
VIDAINAKAKEKMAAINVDWIQKLSQNPNADITHHAPALIIVSHRKDAITGDADCAAAMENMMIAAESLGIGSCWMGLVAFLFDDAELMKGFGVPEGYKTVQAAVFGYKADDARKPGPPRKRDVSNYIGEFD